MSEQNVSAWTQIKRENTLWDDVAFVDGDVYFIVTETRGTSQFGYGYTHIEKLSWDITLDKAYQKTISTSTSSQTVSMDNVFNKAVNDVVSFVAVDENDQQIYIGDFTVDSSNNVEIPPLNVSGDYYFGYKFKQKLQTMPAHIVSQAGDTLYTKKRISKIYVHYYNSMTFTVNGKQIPMRRLDNTTVTSGESSFMYTYTSTGVFETPSITLGWSHTTYVTCEQNDPLPINILGIAVELTT